MSHKTQTNVTDAETYFEEHLRAGDYYSQNREVLGQWRGVGAQLLGVTGTVQRDAFLRLCQNEHPVTGQRLTQRHKTTRVEEGREVANRRVFFDFTFSPPKSVSLMALMADDQRIIEAHDRAVQTALAELEQFAATRVHQRRRITDRITGNVVAATFRHDTSRALDPHLHTHCVVFNATHDLVEGRWKALDNFEMLRARKFVENVYYHELVKELVQFGYTVENRPRGDFEVQGVPAGLCERFSKRHQEIDEAVAKLFGAGIAVRDEKKLREAVSLDKRARKIQGIRPEELRRLWDGQLSTAEKRMLRRLRPAARQAVASEPRLAEDALAWAEEHLFDRHSVVAEHELWRHALEHARGRNLRVDELKAAGRQRAYIRSPDWRGKVTTNEALLREYQIVSLAHDGISRHSPLAPDYDPRGLAADQQEAVKRILGSRNFITLFRGGAGTGKSFALQAVNQGLAQAGHGVLIVTPQRQQAMDLATAGFNDTQTVSEFLTRRRMPRAAVVMVDEAGQIGAKQMLELLQFVQANGGRLILSGDTQQHGAVEASDALRAIEKYSGITPAQLREIRRQNPKLGRTAGEQSWIQEYKQAVAEAQDGKIADSFDRLNRLGAVVECSDRVSRLAAHNLELTAQAQTTVVVSQTWSEIHRLNEMIRAGLQARGLVGKDDSTVMAYERVDLTPAQKRDQRFYDEDTMLVFQRKASGIRRGETGKFWAITDSHLLVETGGRLRAIAVKDVDAFHVCRPRELKLAAGDRLQLKANGEASSGTKLANGELVTVKAVLSDRRIQLQDGRTLPKHFREFVPGYAVTSYASQGKTVDYVLFSDSAIKVATNDQQWYVTISRGRKGVRVFTADKFQLRENIVRSGNRALAMELAGESVRPVRSLDQSRACLIRCRQRVRTFFTSRRQSISMNPKANTHEKQRAEIRV